MNKLNYKDYIGSVNFSEEDGVFWGKILGISDSISYEGDSVESLTADFREAVDEYIEICDEYQKELVNSTFSICLSPETYNAAFLYARQKGLPLNVYIEDTIRTNLFA
ncbi:MAG: type II toxin-antitoxin system HicB family antitoxin [Oscillospiraceae bacterium]|nr:type II toxin-antitoxin system HicB family antitoxin [Oscillospiraceae bacterium]